MPVIPKPEVAEAVLEACHKLAKELKSTSYHGRRIEVQVDTRDIRGGEKNWQWIKKGIPVRIEIGPRDIEKGTCALARRDRAHKEKDFIGLDQVAQMLPGILDQIQANYFSQAQQRLRENTVTTIKNFEEFSAFFTPKNQEKPEIHGGFVLAKWAGGAEEEKKLADLKVTVRCLPKEQSGTTGYCVVSGREATFDAIFAKAY
jgi:prolyl-tRNA synthetase